MKLTRSTPKTFGAINYAFRQKSTPILRSSFWEEGQFDGGLTAHCNYFFNFQSDPCEPTNLTDTRPDDVTPLDSKLDEESNRTSNRITQETFRWTVARNHDKTMLYISNDWLYVSEHPNPTNLNVWHFWPLFSC